MPIATIVHLSDLHFKNDHHNIERLKSIVDDIRTNITNAGSHLCISGDIVYSGDDNLYNIIFDKLVAPLTDIFGNNIYICPGNHDVQRLVASEAECGNIYKDEYQSYLYDKTGNIILSCPFSKGDPLENYMIFQEAICNPILSNYYFSLYDTPHFRLFSLNSTWLSCERTNKESDNGKLRIDPGILDVIIPMIDSTRINIAMAHHPLDWIDIRVKQSIIDRITEYFDIYLFGHSHAPTTLAGTFNASACLLEQAPTTLSKHSYGPNAYSIINIETISKKCEVIYREYSVSRRAFVVGNGICENGIRYPSEADRIFWRDYRSSTPSLLIEKFSKSICNIDLFDWYRHAFLAYYKKEDFFIDVKFSRFEHRNGIEIKSASRSLVQIIDPSIKRQFFFGPQDSGISTSAFIVFRQLCNSISNFKMMPMFLNMKNIQSVNRASILQELKKSSPIPLSNREIESIATSSNVIFLIDNIGINDLTKLNKTVAIMEKYFDLSNIMYFCTSDSGIDLAGSELRIDINSNVDPVYSISEIELSDIKNLITRIYPNVSDSEFQKNLTRITRGLRDMDEPVYPSTALLFLSTMQYIPDSRPINRVRLLDRYVEVLLGRLDFEDIAEGTFNSTNKLSLIGYIASIICKGGQASFSIAEWNGYIKRYSDERMINVPDNLLQEFIAKGIFVFFRDKITFRSDYLYCYFVAKHMQSDMSLLEYVIDSDRFYSHHGEIVAFGELESSNSVRLIDEAYGRICELEERLQEQLSRQGIDLHQEWVDMMRSHDGATEPTTLAATRDEVVRSQPDPARFDHARQREINSTMRSRGVRKRSQIKELESRWLISIRTLLRLLKHSENIDGRYKIEKIEKALESAGLFLSNIALHRDEIANRPFCIIGGVLYFNALAHIDPARSIRDFKYNSTTAIGSMVNDLLGNQQLLPVFAKILENSNEIQSYFIRRMMLDIPIEQNVTLYCDNLKNSTEQSLQICSLKELKLRYVSHSFSEPDKSYYQKLVDRLSHDKGIIMQNEKRHLTKLKLIETAKRGPKSAR